MEMVRNGMLCGCGCLTEEGVYQNGNRVYVLDKSVSIISENCSLEYEIVRFWSVNIGNVNGKRARFINLPHLERITQGV